LSVEAAVVAGIVEEGVGGLRKLYQAGMSSEDFSAYEEEIEWVEQQIENRRPVNRRAFLTRFRDFDWLPEKERLQDLLDAFKRERMFIDANTLVDSYLQDLQHDNVVEKTEFLREQLSTVTKFHTASDVLAVSGWREHLKEQWGLRKLRKAGVPPGIPTDIRHLDHHWDGLVKGRMVVCLGRPGEGKSMLCSKLEWAAIKRKYRVLKFSPEMSPREHRCRLHTLASADKDVQHDLGLKHSFRNRALMNGIGYPLKPYKRFLEYMEDNCGEVIMLTSTHRSGKMSVGFIEAKIEDLSPDLVIIDPLYDLKPPRSRDSYIWEVGEIADRLAQLTEHFNLPFFVTNQAHRQGSERGDAPHKDKSFGSDIPIQRGDYVIGLKNIEAENLLMVRCTKSRFGRDFRFEMKFYGNTGVMKELADPEGNYYNGKDEDADDQDLRAIIGKEDHESAAAREV
jgi:hypothetical protein